MRKHAKRRWQKTKSSKRQCEEKYCCLSIDSEAKYYCEDCHTVQCQACEQTLHETKPKYDLHDRQLLPDVKESELCQASKVHLVCQDQNFPDLWCEQCQLQFCFTCYDSYHASEKRRQHVNISMAHYAKKLEKQLLDQTDNEWCESVEFYHDSETDTVTNFPEAQFSYMRQNDSLTFCSIPTQEEADFSETTDFLSCETDVSPQLDVAGEKGIAGALQPLLPDDRNQVEIVEPFLLLDNDGFLQVTEEEFTNKLLCENSCKVVSLLCETGTDYTHIFNKTFYPARNILKTTSFNSSNLSKTWCAYSQLHRAIVLFTEGPLSPSTLNDSRPNTLLKTLAVSDVVIYGAKAEHLSTASLRTLADLSKAYLHHYKQQLQSASLTFGISDRDLGPALTFLHEVPDAHILRSVNGISTSELLQQMMAATDNTGHMFSKVSYVGVKSGELTTDVSHTLLSQLLDSSVRTARRPEIIFQLLKALDVAPVQTGSQPAQLFPSQYFSCTSKCVACRIQCGLSIQHDPRTQPHQAWPENTCQYQSQLGNKVFMCRTCLKAGIQVLVVPKTSCSTDSSWVGLTKYIWSGYVFECPNCGVIHRSRDSWYGSQAEEEKALHTECRHVWPETPLALDGVHNAARKVIESLHFVADTVTSVGARPAKYLAEWTADKINPSYWVPNSDIVTCSGCQMVFDGAEQKHHCRMCGKGFCAGCSTNKRPVPERGWGPNPVRVCDACLTLPDSEKTAVAAEQGDLTARKVGETVSLTINAMVSALDYPLGIIKSSAKPTYWVPDEVITECYLCQRKFGPQCAIHHCRACGRGVCLECSPNKHPVPLRGWDYPVRVCRTCEEELLTNLNLGI